MNAPVLLAPPPARLLLAPRTDADLLDAYARQINMAHVGCVQAEGRALQYALAAGRLLRKVKALVGHGRFIPWIKQHCRFSYDTALAYKTIADWCEANPERAQYLKSIRQVLEARRQDRVPERLHTVELQMTAEEWGRYRELLGDLDARSEPVQAILDGLEALVRRGA